MHTITKLSQIDLRRLAIQGFTARRFLQKNLEIRKNGMCRLAAMNSPPSGF